MKTHAEREPQTSRQAASAQQEARKTTQPGPAAADNARDTAQRLRMAAAFGPGVAQKAGPEEEMLQGRFAAVQRAQEEDEPLQGRFDTAQRVEEEEPLQGRFAAVQRVEEEEPLQGRFDTAQRAEDKELLQGRFDTAQRAEDEELLQGRFAPVQAKANDTGLPDTLKAGVENLSGVSMDGVQVHYNSSKPAQLNALAYAQGRDIHVAPGQEQHLPHEAWHIAQQAQGRVQPTLAMNGNVPVNDDAGLESEADAMGARAVQAGAQAQAQGAAQRQLDEASGQAAQLRPRKLVIESAQKHYADGWGAAAGLTKDAHVKDKVPDDAKGDGEVVVGLFEAPDKEQEPNKRRFSKDVTVKYKDSTESPKKSVIFHSGPSGRRQY